MAARIKVLRQKKADLTSEARAIVDAAVAADRDLNAAETKRRDDIFKALDRVDEEIRLEEAAMDRDRGGVSGGTPAMPTNVSSLTPYDGARRRELGGSGAALTGFGQTTAEIIDALYGSRRHDNGGFRSASEFFSAIVSGRHDPRLVVAAGQGESGASIGGFLLTSRIEAEIMTLVLEESIFAGRAQFRTMTTATEEHPAFSTETDGANGTFYGLTRQWLTEAGPATVQTAQLNMRQLNAHRAAIVVKITNQLLQDVPTFERQLLALIAKAIGHFQDVDILNGTGAGQPLGILKAPALIVVAKESGQTADTIVYANVLNMWSRLAPQSAGAALWLTSPSCLPQLEQMTIAVGTGGAPVKALTESGGRYTLLGRELIVTHKCAPLGDQGDLVLVDPTQLLIGLRAGMVAARSEHVGFLTDETYLRITTRWDAQPTWNAAHSPGSGHATCSPYVTLAVRA
jgi:HK97 family phage major capsid protein